MILRKLKIHNIRSYKDTEVIFPEGSTLLAGDIGSGKTSILLAVEFALFGLQPSQKGTSLLRNNENEAFVSLEVEIDNQPVVIERKLRRGARSISQSEAYITIDGTREEGSITEIKNKILQLLNYPPEFAKKTNDLYRFTVYTPQEEMKQIILEPAETRLNTLRHVFGIDKYKRVGENIELLGIKMRQEIRVQEAQLKNLGDIEERMKKSGQNLVQQQKKIQELEAELQSIRAEKQQKQKECGELEARIKEKERISREKERAEINLSHKEDGWRAHDKEALALSQQIAEGRKFSFSQQQYEALKQHIKTQKGFLSQAEEEQISVSSRIHSRQSTIQAAENLKKKISGLQKCPTCLQKVDEEYKKNIISNAEKEIAMLVSQNQADQQKKDELHDRVSNIKKQIESFELALSEMDIMKIKLEGLREKEAKVNEIRLQQDSLREDIARLQSGIKKLAESIADYEKYAQAYEQKKIELEKVASKENHLAINIAEVSKEVQFLSQQVADAQQQLTELKEMSRKVEQLKELESWLCNKFLQVILYTEKNIMLKLREEFSGLFSRWFSVLVADDLSVQLDETFTPIVQQSDYEIDYNYLSGGERTAVALAYRLALNQVINSLLSKIKTRDIVILDEPTDGFSESQLDKMRDVLNQLKVRQLILVSHEQKIEDFASNIIRFKKIEGVTEIEA